MAVLAGYYEMLELETDALCGGTHFGIVGSNPTQNGPS